MYRFNIFHLYHHHLKAVVFEISMQIIQTDFHSFTDLDILLKRLNEAVQLFITHNRNEQKYVLPLVFDCEPSICDAFQQEYVKEALLIQNLEHAIIAIDTAKTPFDISFSAKRLQHSFYQFAVLTLEHISKEEELLLPILHRYYSDEILIAVQQRMLTNSNDMNTASNSNGDLLEIDEEILQTWMNLAKNSDMEAYHMTLLSLKEKGHFKRYISYNNILVSADRTRSGIHS